MSRPEGAPRSSCWPARPSPASRCWRRDSDAMTTEKRRPLIAANWKMNLLKADAADYCRELRRGLAAPPTASAASEIDARVVIFPSFPLIPVVARELVDSAVEVGGQDLHP